MGPYEFRVCQVQRDGTYWISDAVFIGDMRAVRQNVVAGWLAGEARWAETASGGMFLFGLDRSGKEHVTGTVHPDFTP